MDEFVRFLQEMAAAFVIVLALGGLVLGLIVTYKAGISSRKRLEERAGLLKQLDDWDAKETQKATELNSQLKEIGRG